MDLQTCRLCKKSNFETPYEAIVKYGVRHYAHFACGLKRWGAEFLDRIPQHQIGLIPFRLVDEYNLSQHPRLLQWKASQKA